MGKRRTNPDQLDLFFQKAKTTPVTARVDDFATYLVAAGVVPNEFYLSLNHGLGVPHDMVLEAPWSLPTRLFRHPIEFVAAGRGSGPSRLLLRHPRLGDHPYVRQVEAVIGATITWEDEDEFGRQRGELPEWWHAVDLMTDAHWRDLCCLSHFTTREAMIGAVAFAVSLAAGYDGSAKRRPALAIASARYLLGVLGADEPADRSAAFLGGDGLSPGHIVEHHPRTGKLVSERWAVNILDRGPAGAWAHVHGIEDGWLYRDRSGHLQVSAEGLKRRTPSQVAA